MPNKNNILKANLVISMKDSNNINVVGVFQGSIVKASFRNSNRCAYTHMYLNQFCKFSNSILLVMVTALCVPHGVLLFSYHR